VNIFKISKLTVIIVGVVIIVFLVWWGTVSYRPRLLNPGNRNAVETVRDFFSFSWHFSRQAWLARSRDWPGAGREKLLAFWYRPGYRDYKDLREKSLWELARAYAKASLNTRAAEIYLLAHKEDRKNQWLSRRVGDKLRQFKDWDKLEIVARDILGCHPGDKEALRWLKLAMEKKDDR